jgi:hypothetical protein
MKDRPACARHTHLLKSLRASARRLSLADALNIIRYRGALERLLGAHHSTARTGPYDAIFDTFKCEDREVALDLEPLLPLLGLLRRLRCLRLSTFRHCCPPSHVTWRMSSQYGRESTRTAFRLLQHNEKNSLPLNETCTWRTFWTRRSARIARGLVDASSCANAMRARASATDDAKNIDEIRIFLRSTKIILRSTRQKICAHARVFS